MYAKPFFKDYGTLQPSNAQKKKCSKRVSIICGLPAFTCVYAKANVAEKTTQIVQIMCGSPAFTFVFTFCTRKLLQYTKTNPGLINHFCFPPFTCILEKYATKTTQHRAYQSLVVPPGFFQDHFAKESNPELTNHVWPSSLGIYFNNTWAPKFVNDLGCLFLPFFGYFSCGAIQPSESHKVFANSARVFS